MSEEWRQVDGFGGLYFVSNLGRIKVKDREYINNLGRKRKISSHIVAQSTTSSGYKCVQLRYSGKMKAFMVHRLVAKYFVDNPQKLNEVNHKDENKSNNACENLEWCTRSYNCKYGSGLDKRKKKCSKPVIQMLCGEIINEFPSMIEAQRKTGIKIGSISRCCNGNGHTAGGYEWRFKVK